MANVKGEIAFLGLGAMGFGSKYFVLSNVFSTFQNFPSSGGGNIREMY